MAEKTTDKVPSKSPGAKTYLGLLVGLVAFALILVNAESTDVNLLFTTVTMPLALILFVMFALGYLSALLAVKFRKKN